jgi:hypothetical protein
MSFRHSCFISYCHGEGELIRPFIEQLRSALDSCLEPYLDEKVFLDADRLRPGYRFNEALGRALCESVSMIMVYVPKYERHDYCMREFSAMEAIERKRLAMLGDNAHGMGLIIPVVLRGRTEDLPAWIRDRRHFCDFSRFTTASRSIRSNSEYAQKVDNISSYIFELYRLFQSSLDDPCADCHSFELPTTKDMDGVRISPQEQIQPFPFRERET